MTITLYDCSTAPSPRRARILLAEKSIETKNIQIDMRQAEQLSDAYKKINPACTVPALKLGDGTILTENAGIAAWAEAYQPEPALLGKSPNEKGLVATWNAKIELEGLMAVAEVLRNSSKSLTNRATTGPNNYAQIPDLAIRGRKRIGHFLDVLNERLEGREFIATDDFTVADITALVVIDFAKWVKVEPGEEHGNIKRWHSAISARPSTQA